MPESWIIGAIVAVAILIALGILLRRGSRRADARHPVSPVEPGLAAAEAAARPQAPEAVPQPPRPPSETAVVAAAVAGTTPLASLSEIEEDEEEKPADDLRRIKGIGPKIVTLLHGRGVTRYAQIAAWTTRDLAEVNAALGSFAGRPERDNWVDQARLLASGDVSAYEAKYGKL